VEIRSYHYQNRILISGTLLAKGTASDSIKFRGFANPEVSNISTHGGSLRFEVGSKNSQLEYISMDKWGDSDYYIYGYGYYSEAININSSDVSIKKSTIRNSENMPLEWLLPAFFITDCP